MKNFDKKYHGMLRDIKDAQKAALAPFLGQKVNVYSALTEHASEVTITDVRPVLVEFLKFLLDLAKLSVRNVSGFKVAEVVAMLEVARVAIACPVSWTDSQIDELAVNLEEAGYPDNTIITSEAMANAVFHLVDKAKKGQPELKKFLGIENKQITKGILRKLALVICDVGHGTTDLASIAVKGLEPFVQLAEFVSGKGSLSGSQRLTNMFANFVHKNRAGDVETILADSDCSEQELLAGLCDQFERIKPRLDVERKRTLVRSDIWYHSDNGVIESEPAEMTLVKQEISCIVDDWCQEIVSLIESQIERTKNQDSEIEYVEVYLSGGGLQSRALQAKVRHQLASEEVKVSVSDADSDRSAVAQGNLWALLNEGELCRPKYARVSYGIPLDVQYESDNSNHVEAELIHGLSVGRFHGEPYLVNSIHWAIIMDNEVKGGTIEGTITATDELDNFDEITLMQEVLWSSHNEVAKKSEAFSATAELQKGTVTSCGFLRLEVGSAEDAGFEVVEVGYLKSFTVDFRAKIQHKGVLPHWVFSVPRGGTWERSKLYEAGQQCFTAEMSLKNMREVQAQVNAKK